MVCQPTHRSFSSSGSVLLAMICSMAGDVETFAGVLAGLGAILALAVVGFERGTDARHLGQFLGIVRRRRGYGGGQLQQEHLARQLARELQVVVTRGLLGEFGGGADEDFVGLGRHLLGVVGDEVRLHPGGAARLDGKIVQPDFSVLDEIGGFLGSGWARLSCRSWGVSRSLSIHDGIQRHQEKKDETSRDGNAHQEVPSGMRLYRGRQRGAVTRCRALVGAGHIPH